MVSAHPKKVINPNAPLADSVARSPKRQNLQMSSKVLMIANHITIATIRKIIRMKKRIHSAGQIKFRFL
jgi:hypothetical protein